MLFVAYANNIEARISPPLFRRAPHRSGNEAILYFNAHTLVADGRRPPAFSPRKRM